MIDIHFESQDLLHKLANSIYDRNMESNHKMLVNPASGTLFTTKELHLVEKFLEDYAKNMLEEIAK